MAILYILSIIGVIAVVGALLLVLSLTLSKKPDLPRDLFEDCRGDLRQLQDWYFSQKRYEDVSKITLMLKSVDEIWAAYDMESEA